MITFYRVNNLTWWMGRHLVNVPFFSMVNLVAGRRVVPEFIQDEMTASNLANEALGLLGDETAIERMRQELRGVAQRLSGPDDPMEVAASIVESYWESAPRAESGPEGTAVTSSSVVRA